MDTEKEDSIIRIIKVIFTFIAVVSLIFVGYNIALYTNTQDIEVLAGIK